MICLKNLTSWRDSNPGLDYLVRKYSLCRRRSDFLSAVAQYEIRALGELSILARDALKLEDGQGDKIGRIFAQLCIYSGQFFNHFFTTFYAV
jgi:hypothetical protein